MTVITNREMFVGQLGQNNDEISGGCMTYKWQPEWPKVSRSAEDILRFLEETDLGLDLEGDMRTGEPTILGIGNAEWAVSVTFKQGLPMLKRLLENNPDIIWHGHNIIGYDLMILEKFGIQIPLCNVEDSILKHYLVNMHLCKSTRKEADPDDLEERKGRGFMNIFTMASIYTDLRCWKYCKDGVKFGTWKPAKECDSPCPIHEPYWYNGIDCIAPVIANPKMRKTMILRGVEKLYPLH
jgi:hypothetical protein